MPGTQQLSLRAAREPAAREGCAPAGPTTSSWAGAAQQAQLHHGLWFSCTPTGTFLQPHIYLMLMPCCLDIHNVQS